MRSGRSAASETSPWLFDLRSCGDGEGELIVGGMGWLLVEVISVVSLVWDDDMCVGKIHV
jgi:hypothetical protein